MRETNEKPEYVSSVERKVRETVTIYRRKRVLSGTDDERNEVGRQWGGGWRSSWGRGNDQVEDFGVGTSLGTGRRNGPSLNSDRYLC